MSKRGQDKRPTASTLKRRWQRTPKTEKRRKGRPTMTYAEGVALARRIIARNRCIAETTEIDPTLTVLVGPVKPT